VIFQCFYGQLPGEFISHVGRVESVADDAILVAAACTEHIPQDRLGIGSCSKLLVCGEVWLLRGFRARGQGCGGTACLECLCAQAAEPAALARLLAQVADFADGQPVQEEADLAV
jgi:hypothetical protein